MEIKKIGQKTDAITPRALCLTLFYWAGLVAHNNERAPQRHRVGNQKLLSLAAREKKRGTGARVDGIERDATREVGFGTMGRSIFSGLG